MSVRARGLVLAFSLLGMPGTGCLSADNGEHTHRWYELEQLLSHPQWLTSNYWRPSGGLFAYPGVGAAPATVSVQPGGRREWSVWLRVRDETRGMRRATAAINGQACYVMGGTDAGQWVWYQVGVVNAAEVNLMLISMPGRHQMDAWFDALLLTDDIGFVPPSQPPTEGGYMTYRAEEDVERGRRPAWIWWPAHPDAGTFGYYRQALRLSATPARATLSVGAVGEYVLYLNGREVALGSTIGSLLEYDLTGSLKKGVNVLAFEMEHRGFLPGLRVHLTALLPDASETHMVSDLTWQASDTAVEGWLEADFDEGSWQRPWARIGEREVVGY